MFGEHWARVVLNIASETRGINATATCTGWLQFLLKEVATMPGGNGAGSEADSDPKSQWNPPPPQPPPPPSCNKRWGFEEQQYADIQVCNPVMICRGWPNSTPLPSHGDPVIAFAGQDYLTYTAYSGPQASLQKQLNVQHTLTIRLLTNRCSRFWILCGLWGYDLLTKSSFDYLIAFG